MKDETQTISTVIFRLGYMIGCRILRVGQYVEAEWGEAVAVSVSQC